MNASNSSVLVRFGCDMITGSVRFEFGLIPISHYNAKIATVGVTTDDESIQGKIPNNDQSTNSIEERRAVNRRLRLRRQAQRQMVGGVGADIIQQIEGVL